MLRLRANLPVSWIGVDTMRVGVQDPAVALRVTDDEARAIVAMREGLSKSELVRSVGRVRANEIVTALSECFDATSPEITRIRVSGKTPIATPLRMLVRDAHLAAGIETATVLMPVTMWKMGDKTWQRYLINDRLCLPVVVGDRYVTFGPLWRGDGNLCWRCANPSPPHPLPLPDDAAGAIRFDPLETAVVLGCAGEVLRRLQRGELAIGEEASLDRHDGQVTWRQVPPLATCPCQADLFAPKSLQGIEKADADCVPTRQIA